jgi:hypothetical protein
MIEESEFAIFDVTTWNPNVALELGIAIGSEQDSYILFNPTTQQEHPMPGVLRPDRDDRSSHHPRLDCVLGRD